MAEFNLTEGPDTIIGTGSDDTITGGTAALGTQDNITGGGGRDRLESGTVPQGTQAPTISDVEELILNTAGLPFSVRNVTGAERLAAQGSSIVVEDIDAARLDVRYGAIDVGSGEVVLQFEGGALSAPDDELKLSVDTSNVTFTTSSTFDSTADGEANATPDRLRIEAIDLELDGPATVEGEQFTNQVDLSTYEAITELTISGSGFTEIVLGSPDLEEVDATATTDGIVLTSDIAGDQTIKTGTGDDDIKTGGGNDVIATWLGDDIIDAGEGDNRIWSGDGNDEITSEAGNDFIKAKGGDDTIDSGSGVDEIIAGAGNDTIRAGDGADEIHGNLGNDTIFGQGGADTIYDNRGDDTVDGGGDDDRIIAGQGNDEFTGGGGVDTFVFGGGVFNTDTVTDFTLTSSTETNDIVEFVFGGATQTLQSQAEFETFFDANTGSTSVDTATDTLTIQADGGTIILEVSDADFLA